jgi:hypothetical protein
MAYNSFQSVDEVQQLFGLSVTSSGSLFATIRTVPASEQLQRTLAEGVSLALNINTEKARSEFIIAPVLLEVRRLLEYKVSLFSGIDFSVDADRGLNGYCDFLLSYSPDQVFLEAPVACIVEAKNENIRAGYAQCIAEMLAARIFNERRAHPICTILGVVTTGSNWKFLTLEGTHVAIDFEEYLISQIGHILGIFVATMPGVSSAPA